MHHPESALRVPLHRLHTRRSICPLAIAFERRNGRPSRQAPRKVKRSPPTGSSRPQNRSCRLSNCRSHNCRHPRLLWGRNCMQPDRCNQGKWFRRLHKSRTHPTRCLHNRRTDLRCQARHRRHTRPPHCLRSRRMGPQCPVLRKHHIHPALRNFRRRPSHWDRSCMPLGLCNQGRSFHRPRTHRTHLPRCPRNRKTGLRSPARHKHRIRRSACLRNRMLDQQCPVLHKRRTHRVPGKTHRPPRPLGQNCTPQGQYNPPGKSNRRRRKLHIRLQHCLRNRMLPPECQGHRTHRTRLRRCPHNRTCRATDRCNRTPRQHRDHRTPRIRPIPGTSHRRTRRLD